MRVPRKEVRLRGARNLVCAKTGTGRRAGVPAVKQGGRLCYDRVQGLAGKTVRLKPNLRDIEACGGNLAL
jgi:hypothetical protein